MSEIVCICGSRRWNIWSDGALCCDKCGEAAPHALRAAPASRTEETPPEARLAAFAKRYDAQSVSVSYDVHAPPFEDPWNMAWRRRYADGALSDWRETVASSFAGLVSAAEEIEAENDKREPQHAGRASEPNGSAEGAR